MSVRESPSRLLSSLAIGRSASVKSGATTAAAVAAATHNRTRSTFEDTDEEDVSDSAPLLTRASRLRAQPHFHRATPRPSFRSRVRGLCAFKEGSIAIFLGLAILLLILLTIIGGLLLRPFFTTGLLMASGASLGFVLTEARSLGAWHHNREAENRFWIFVAIILSTTIVFAPDSPLSGLGSAFPVVGIMCVIASAGWVHYYDRKLEREELGRAPHLRRVSSFILSDQESTKQKLQVVQDCLAALDFRFVAAKAINQSQIQEAERDILNLLKSCDADELNYIVTNVNLALLFYKIKDKDILAFNKTEVQNRTRVLELLARERLADLKIQARVVVLDALMSMRLKAHASAERWVRDIIVGTHGRMLTRMKNACDLKGRVHNFHKLVYRDITSSEIREEIITHLRNEAEVVKNDGLLPKERRKILSDVDDTLFSSGGKFPAGLDRRYPHHVLYPGVCFPEHDTRVLTDEGFMFLEQIEERRARGGPELRYACYDIHSRQLVYRSGELVLPSGDEHELVDFTASGSRSTWSNQSGATEKDAGNHLSLRVTIDHDMYAELGHRAGDADDERIEWTAPTKMKAAELLCECTCDTTDCSHRRAYVRMLACADAGAETNPQLDAELDSMRHALGLHTEEQVDALFSIYGAWLVGGRVDDDSIHFASLPASSDALLEPHLHAAGLESDEWTRHDDVPAGQRSYTITAPRWCKYFASQRDADCASAVRLWRWMRHLDKRRLRLVVDRLRLASDAESTDNGEQTLRVASASLRDDLLVALLHAGYSARLTAAVNGWLLHFADPTNPLGDSLCRPVLHRPSEVRVERYSGRVWCVRVSHADHLIVAQRATRSVVDGVVSLASRPIVVGQCSFYKELDLGANSSTGEWEEGRQGNLTFLSARPHVYKAVSESKSYKLFEELRLMKKMGLHCVPTLLSGSLDSGFHMFRGLYEPMSAKKFKNFTEYAALYPEFTFCFIGDNGQGDARAGELIKAALPDQVEAIFIHEVQPIHRTPGYINYESRARYDQLGIYFFHTYVGAALQATKLRMIHPNGLRRIILDAELYFVDIKQSLKLTFQAAEERRAELNRDIESANEYLIEIGHAPAPLIPTECVYLVGSSVETAWGVGIVEKFNPISGIYQIRLTEWRLTNSAVRVYLRSGITWHTKGTVGDAVATRFGTGILQEIREQNGVHVIKLTEWGHAASLPLVPGGSQLATPNAHVSSPTAYLQPADFTVIVAAVGDQVRTLFGVGLVTKYRPPCANVSPPESSSSALVPSSPLPTAAAAAATDRVVHLHCGAPPCVASHQSAGYTNVGIYECVLAWHDRGGAIAYLNGRSIRKIRETSQRRCIVQ